MIELFPMIPASSKPLWFLGGIILFLLILTGLFSYIAYSSKTVQFEISKEGLNIRGGFYKRLIPAESIIVEKSKQIDIGKESSYKPILRTNGIGLPGYASGWFKLRNGEKALLFITNPSRVVYIATREGYSVLLSVQDAERFLQLIGNVSKDAD
ncbi:MAG: hypothetical protein GQ555_02110 [Desulfobacterales bacterium]|nr:hypothetical protein [Desulfobacterales bacterium]